MSDFAEFIKGSLLEKGCQIVKHRELKQSETITFMGTADTLRPLGIGYRPAWEALIDDNRRDGDAPLYVCLTINKHGLDRVRIVEPEQIEGTN
jgi:hypothetical protein